VSASYKEIDMKLNIELDDVFLDSFDTTLTNVIMDEIVTAIRKEVKTAIRGEQKQVKACVGAAVRKAVRTSVNPDLVDKLIKEQLK
jgi:Asp-tRNA(Asn)/Glu-tRNA(Gln) amidotransferase B subunit